ncbi:MAG: tRNA (guanosine(37)-N1)-methyltransferase TrmD [Spirochaetales bacterium]|nr:tRNA (guanosine(37)-N1)-methyltransferase TrmD [Spirochaetales bacterium]
MKITILTIAPETFESFRKTPVVVKAEKNNGFELEIVDIRDYADGSFRKIDDSPYGGGRGMVLRVDTVSKAIEAVRTPESQVVLLSPKGRTYSQKKAHEFSGLEHLVLVCGHFEGTDARIERYADEQISIGDYILTGGELAAMTICDSVARLLPETLREGSAAEESFEDGILEYPQYTHPVEYNGDRVPEVLLTGNAKEIKRFRKIQAIVDTIRNRPDLLDKLSNREENIGRSDARVLIFDGMILKIQKEGKQSEREEEALKWLEGKLPVPRILACEHRDGRSYILMEKAKGRMLCDPVILNNRNRLTKTAAAALKMLWAVDICDCPFAEGDIKGKVLCHGDLCLPNVFADNKGITGFIDLGSCHIGERKEDLEMCLWSLEANLTGEYSDNPNREPLDREAFLKLLQ